MMHTEHFKERLEEELTAVDRAIAENTRAPREEDATATEKDELADKIEDLEEGQSENAALLARRRQIAEALDKISDGSYGVCEIGGEPIEEERLEADAAAPTCIAHKGN
jgi:RNA polymerase-binding transcription factor DksA